MTNLKVVDSWPNFPTNVNAPSGKFVSLFRGGRKRIFDLTTLTIKRGTVTKLNSRASYSPFAASWEKTATVNQFYNGLSSFPEIDFSLLLQLLALAYTTPRVPPYARRYFYVMAACWISSKGCKSNNQNVRTFLRWNTATVLRAGFSSMKLRFCWRK